MRAALAFAALLAATPALADGAADRKWLTLWTQATGDPAAITSNTCLPTGTCLRQVQVGEALLLKMGVTENGHIIFKTICTHPTPDFRDCLDENGRREQFVRVNGQWVEK